MDAALKAIAEPHRREILSLVQTRELTAGEIASHFAVSRPAISQHLNVLKDAGLLDERREGTKRIYSVRSEGLVPLLTFLEQFWDERLDALKREAELEERRNHERD